MLWKESLWVFILWHVSLLRSWAFLIGVYRCISSLDGEPLWKFASSGHQPQGPFLVDVSSAHCITEIHAFLWILHFCWLNFFLSVVYPHSKSGFHAVDEYRGSFVNWYWTSALLSRYSELTWTDDVSYENLEALSRSDTLGPWTEQGQGFVWSFWAAQSSSAYF